MKSSSVMKFVVVLVLVVLAYVPAASAQCPTPGCDIGLAACNQYVKNPMLVHGCGWNRATTAGYVNLTQAVNNLATEDMVIPIDEEGDMEVSYELVVIPSNPGTERLRVEILIGFTIVETIDIHSPSSSGGLLTVPMANYAGQTITLRFRRVAGSAPGGTTFRIEKAHLFAMTTTP